MHGEQAILGRKLRTVRQSAEVPWYQDANEQPAVEFAAWAF